jgi:hypothetical protein
MLRADYDKERNITSSDVEFLEGRDVEKENNVKTTWGGKDKPESTPSRASSIEHVSMSSDLSGFQAADCDADMNDIMLVMDQMTDKRDLLYHTQPGGRTVYFHSSQAKERPLSGSVKVC